jgi:hypothetical protein
LLISWGGRKIQTREALKGAPDVTLWAGTLEFTKQYPALVSAVAGGVTALAISSFVKHGIMHPVISAVLVKRRGCYVETDVGDPPQYKAKYLRLLVENTGLSSIRDCSGYITKITKRRDGKDIQSEDEVVDLGWSSKSADARSIPREAFFHMDVISLHLKPSGNELKIARLPYSLVGLFDGTAADYEFNILVAADNARPRPLAVKFSYDPNRKDLILTSIRRARFPWWAGCRRLRSRWQARRD